jgi:hypothetical protein
LESIKDAVFRNGTLKAYFFRDIWRVENVRKGFDLREISYIQTILDEGVNNGLFEIEDTSSMSVILHYAFKGLEVPYIRGIMRGFSPSDSGNTENIISLLFNGIKRK